MKVIICKNNVEYTYMDFSLPNDSTLQQIQPDNSFLQITITSDNKIIMGDTIAVKGFIRESTFQNGAIKGWYYFSPDLGFVYQYEYTERLMFETKTITMIEYLFYDSLGNIYHQKHSNTASIQFNPITQLNFGQNLQQEFMVAHPFSARTYHPSQIGCTYLDSVYLDLFYSNGIESGFYDHYPISSLSEIDYSLNYQVNTALYLQGYNLYYRIIAKDKGIVPSYYYKPATGYYKLIYNPSPVQVLFSQDSIYIPTLGDTGSVKIVNTSDHSVRIDSTSSVGAFYGYRGFFSKPGFEYPFYLFQTLPSPQWNDTLGIVIPPHDSINVSFYEVDLCPICDYEVQDYFKDTLRFVFTFMDGNIFSFSNSIPISGEGHPSDIADIKLLPNEFVLNQNYPNPFNPITKISWQSPASSWQTLKIFDVLGKEVATLVNEYRDAGKYELEFNAEKLSSGVYYYQLRAGSFVETKKMIYLK